jgi:hypothetical protein
MDTYFTFAMKMQHCCSLYFMPEINILVTDTACILKEWYACSKNKARTIEQVKSKAVPVTGRGGQ